MIPPFDDRLPTPDGDENTSAFHYLAFAFPDNPDLLLFWFGVMTILEYSSSWDSQGTLSADDTARIFSRIALSRMKLDMLLGLVVPTIANPLPDGLLLADGSTYEQADYPQLSDVLPASMKSETQFTLPDLRDKFILSSGAVYAENATGGEAEHTLTIAEMPAHTHTSDYPSLGIDLENVGVPDVTGLGNPPLPTSTTSSSGNGQPHNNMPPYHALRYAIIAKLTN